MSDEEDNENCSGTYPTYGREWKRRQIQKQDSAYEGKVPKAEKEPREERVSMKFEGYRRR